MLIRLARKPMRMLHTKEDTRNIPHDFGEGQHHMLVFNVSARLFSVIAVRTVFTTAFKISHVHRVLEYRK